MKLTPEQQQVVDRVQQGFHVLVDAVAGAGKTSTVLALACAFARPCLMLTFSAHLKRETRHKTKELQKQNKTLQLEVHSYHSVANRYFCPTSNDEGLFRILHERLAPSAPLPWELIILDECQDMNTLSYLFVRYLIQQCVTMQVVVLGDQHQTLFQHMGADHRFMTMAQQLWHGASNASNASSVTTANDKQREWCQITLSRTFRCPVPVAQLVNTLLGHERLISASAERNPIRYFQVSYFDIERVLDELHTFLKQHDIPPDQVFLIFPSTRVRNEKTVPSRVQRRLTQHRYRLFIPNDDFLMEGRQDPFADKMVLLNIHLSKGLERDVVVLFNFDQSYYEFYARHADPHTLPQTLYVALTRARKHLWVVQESSRDAVLPQRMAQFWEMGPDMVERVGEVKKPDEEKKDDAIAKKPFKRSVIQLMRSFSSETIHELLQLTTVDMIHPPGDDCALPTYIKPSHESKGIEIISDVIGTVLPLIFACRLQPERPCLVAQQLNLADVISKFTPRYQTEIRRLADIRGDSPLRDWIRLALLWDAHRSNFFHRLIQVPVKKITQMEQLIERCLKQFDHVDIQHPEEAEFEAPVHQVLQCGTEEILVDGRIDMRDTEKVWEFKYTSNLDDPTFRIQLMLYAWLTGFTKTYFLFNIRTGELRQIHFSPETADAIIRLLKKRVENHNLSDEEFIAKHQHQTA